MSVNIITWYVNPYLVNINQQRITSIKSGNKPRLLHILRITLMGVDIATADLLVYLISRCLTAFPVHKESWKKPRSSNARLSYFIIASFDLSLYRYGIQRRHGQVITIVTIIIAIGVYRHHLCSPPVLFGPHHWSSDMH